MTSTINDSDLYNENNIIRVEWVDSFDNYTATKERDIIKYFQKKYGTAKVKVDFKPIINLVNDIDLDISDKVDASELILDEEYQKKLIDKYIELNNIEINMDYLMRLDKTVNTYLEDYKDGVGKFKKFKIKEIEFSNFLSYGFNNKINFTEYNGITSVVSSPKNFGGKTTLTVDLLLFLFFGKTTKSDKLEDVFNKYLDSDDVVVKGVIEIEGDNYVIKRTIKRELTKKSEYNVKSTLDFYQQLPKGGVKKLNGDQKNSTNKLIKEYVGTYDDFLLTILTTGDNLSNLLNTKPTERGKILMRYIGLEYFKEKEAIAKKLYSDWKVTSNLNKYSVIDVNDNIASEKEKIADFQNIQLSYEKKLSEIKDRLLELNNEYDNLLSKRVNNVDNELYKINESDIIDGINKLNNYISDKETNINELKNRLKVTDKDFDIDYYGNLVNLINETKVDISSLNIRIESINNDINILTKGQICQTCERPLEGVDNSVKIGNKQKELDGLNVELSTLQTKLVDYTNELGELSKLKVVSEENDKVNLLIDKNEAELKGYKDSLIRGQEKLKLYRDNLVNIENNKNIDTSIGILKSKISNVESEKDNELLNINSIKKDIEYSEKKIVEYNEILVSLKKDELVDNIYKTYVDVYGKNGISKMVLGTMMPLINSHLRNLLMDSAEFILEVRLNSKNEVDFIMVDIDNGVERSINSGSGYEMTVAALALRCVLSKVCSLPKPNIILFDEVTGKVAENNLELIRIFFDKIKEFFDHVWLISHNQIVNSWADNTIKVIKNDNVSSIDK